MTALALNLDALVEAVADRVAAKVLARLTAPATHYGSGANATLPPGKSRAWALRNLKSIAGARKVGRDWVVSVDDFDAWVTERDAARLRKAGKPVNDVSPDIAALVEQGLSEAGFRGVRAAR